MDDVKPITDIMSHESQGPDLDWGYGWLGDWYEEVTICWARPGRGGSKGGSSVIRAPV